MHSPRAIVFDLDGTLIDSRGDIAAACNHALVATGRRSLSPEVIARFVGDGARTLCSRAAGLSEHEKDLDEVLEIFLEYYTEHPIDHTRWMPHAQRTLELVGVGMPIALCTNKARRVTDAVLTALGVRTRFAVVVAGGDLPEKKPAPGPIMACARAMRVEPSAMIVVGDGPQDVAAGRACGCRTVGVEGGFLPRDRLVASHPDVIIPSLAELPSVIQRWAEATRRS